MEPGNGAVTRIGLWAIAVAVNPRKGSWPFWNFRSWTINRFYLKSNSLNYRPRPLGSHGLCPVFYNIAFRHKFLAVKKHKTCKEPINERDLTVFPDEGIRMGYFQNITNSAYNEVNLYAITKSKPPYYHSTL